MNVSIVEKKIKQRNENVTWKWYYGLKTLNFESLYKVSNNVPLQVTVTWNEIYVLKLNLLNTKILLFGVKLKSRTLI